MSNNILDGPNQPTRMPGKGLSKTIIYGSSVSYNRPLKDAFFSLKKQTGFPHWLGLLVNQKHLVGLNKRRLLSYIYGHKSAIQSEERNVN